MQNKSVLIFGATGNIGGAATRELLKRNWQVRAVTRTPNSEKAHILAELGAEVVQADMEDRNILEKVFDGMKRVLSVQNWTTSGVEGEMRQGKLVADVAHSVGVRHLVYVSAGNGDRGTGIPHFENKIEVEDYMRELRLPFTIIRPTPFMELMTEKEFYPAMATWGVEPKIVGWDLPIPWVSVYDLGQAVANAFDDPEKWIGKDVPMCGDIKTLGENQAIFTAIDGRKPSRIPLPIRLFEKMAGDEFVAMWKWMDEWIGQEGTPGLQQIMEQSHEMVPEMLDMESWLRKKRNGGFG
ncbi:MAG: NmrA/HSCARG family protein [Anaerolineales bacterium]|jgi:uncharacterized protein YbjT (DUF2867 family)